jgi:quercetin 2,3-dioxygenase
MEVFMQYGNIRTIKKIITGQSATDGAGVKLVRVIGYHDTKEFDPFLMLDAFDSTNPSDYIKGFPWHPHRGIETVTYLISGSIEHGDSMGNKGCISSGDCQWMTAGSGIIHQEMPQPSDRMLGTQLWLNLPAKNKMSTPKYRPIEQQAIPISSEHGVKVHIICGEYNGMMGAIEGDYVKALYLDVEINPGAEWKLTTHEGDTQFIYIVSGEVQFDDVQYRAVTQKHAVLFNSGTLFKVNGGKDGARFLLMSGRPLNEPIAWGGPIVMNTKEELDLAFRELDDDTFIK